MKFNSACSSREVRLVDPRDQSADDGDTQSDGNECEAEKAGVEVVRGEDVGVGDEVAKEDDVDLRRERARLSHMLRRESTKTRRGNDPAGKTTGIKSAQLTKVMYSEKATTIGSIASILNGR